ncbi:MAG: hypothetical protein SFX73_36035 [Kofleriaceae bacterium]|nr:hypothetical protein [Kofleriaceae bacterium]
MLTREIALLHEKLDDLTDITGSIELELVDNPRWAEPSDTSYLNARDRADPDIMSNVDAMTATNQLIEWFGRDMEGFVGLWRGPSNTPREQAPIVRLDSEGQYALVATNIGDYLAISTDEDDFDDNRVALITAGFTVAASRDAIWASVPDRDNANDYRHKLYNEGRVKRGLTAIRD